MVNTRANTFWSLENGKIQKLEFCLQIPFSKNSNHIEMNELVCAANQFTGFCIIGVFTESFGTDIKLIQVFLGPLPSVNSVTHI